MPNSKTWWIINLMMVIMLFVITTSNLIQDIKTHTLLFSEILFSIITGYIIYDIIKFLIKNNPWKKKL